MKRFLFIPFLYCIIMGKAQKIQVLDQSSFKHDYVVSSMVYLENLGDTVRGRYIATLRIHDKHEDEIIGNWINLMSMKSKELGGNIYYVSGYKEVDEYATLDIKVYFVGEKVLKNNKLLEIKNKAYVFNQSRRKTDSAYFFLDKNKTVFDSKKFYELNIEDGKIYTLEVMPHEKGGVKEMFVTRKSASFYIIPDSKKQFTSQPGIPRTNGINIIIKRNRPFEIDYDLGRFLLAIYSKV
ncbi:MAG: hypothetical protein ACXVNM_02915 [Bacteroidia bacterium]